MGSVGRHLPSHDESTALAKILRKRLWYATRSQPYLLSAGGSTLRVFLSSWLISEIIVIPAFAGVYEQGRAAAQLDELQALANQEFMSALEQIREEAERIADSAGGARRASKRAVGDWF